MIEQDMDVIKKFFPEWKKRHENVKTIALLSPNKEQADFIRQLFPKAKVTELTIFGWDLNDKNAERYDLIYAASVFMAADDPKLWFQNVLDSCKTLWVQDHVKRWRGGHTECDRPTGDNMRFSYKEHKARLENAYDLANHNVVAFEPYDAGESPGQGKEPVSFIAEIVGHDHPQVETKTDVKKEKVVVK